MPKVNEAAKLRTHNLSQIHRKIWPYKDCVVCWPNKRSFKIWARAEAKLIVNPICVLFTAHLECLSSDNNWIIIPIALQAHARACAQLGQMAKTRQQLELWNWLIIFRPSTVLTNFESEAHWFVGNWNAGSFHWKIREISWKKLKCIFFGGF